ncbi:AMP-binding protein [Actinocrinis puniceicyclus]|uniref:AMP-binding protein n=1 Tax=Actinocrinis puniceicyclus TaxID=977794 RepID=A0A8J7WK69_9ACTN|nr:AMP-binding protein [Actinocrinis puniceicyclus]MBS2962375.1 AMP-binding protein [Actinocrinis puniceicyclus]
MTEYDEIIARTATDPDEHLRRMIDWHFDPRTGSRFWLERAAKLDFDPRAEITTVADLRRFPDLSDDLRHVPVEDLIPAGAAGEPFDVFDSGGTTGAPKRIVESVSRAQNADWVADVLGAHGFPDRGNWLHVGPSGPHVVGRTMRRIAHRRGGLFFTVDMDPRWVKKLIAAGRGDVARDYVQHLVDQIELVVASQDIRVLFITPTVLEAVCERESLYAQLSERLGGLLWAGTSASPETLRLIEEELFPNTRLAGLYGNTLMGIAVQRPKQEDDVHPCVYRPYHPASIVEIVDEESREPVPYGERGTVLMHLMFRDMFLPNVLERDAAVRIAPGRGDTVDGIADIGPVASAEVIEGVY